MKKSMKHSAFFTLILLSAFGLISCFDPYPDDEFIFMFPARTDIAKPEGSVVAGMNENVFITFPAGAVDQELRILVDEIDNINNYPFLLKMIRIDPSMEFNKPVTIGLKCDGDLLLGYDPPGDNCPLEICFWETEEEYQNRVCEKCICCCLDPEAKIINFLTMKSGVFAVRERNKGSYN